MGIEIKRDPYLWAFAAVLVVGVMTLIGFDKVSFKEGGAFIVGALAMPALFGSKKKDDDGDPPAQTPLFVDERKAETLPVPREPSPLPRHPYREPVDMPVLAPIAPATRPTLRPAPKMLSTLRLVLASTAILVVCAGGSLPLACTSATPAQKSTTANATYAADQLRCVQESPTKALEDACRARVRAIWHVDAGAEGGAR